MDSDTDREILDAALSVIGLTPPPTARLMWIDNTLRVTGLECSHAYYEEARDRSDLEILTAPRQLPFDEKGNLAAVSGCP